MDILKTNGLKQIILLVLISFTGIVLIWQLQYFMPGFLGAVTLYILLRKYYFNLTIKRRWKRWMAATILIATCVVVFVIPIWLLVQLLMPKFTYAFEHSGELMAQGNHLIVLIKQYLPRLNINEQQFQQGLQRIMTVIPTFLNATLNATASVLLNTLTAFFILYFMLLSGRNMEKKIVHLLPLKHKNIDSLWSETKNMVVSNAIGIPVLMLCQCIIAILGYWMFGVPQSVVWGILTGVASIIPMVGTMIVWVPICIIVIASGKIGIGIGLILYCAIVVSNTDNVLRFTLLKKIGDVHPLITVFGVIAGLQLFGIMGLIFGPLLIAYFILLIKIYRLEFSSDPGLSEGTTVQNEINQTGVINKVNINKDSKPEQE
ncbi:MAG: AI-2E family transporter [Taibaiella sp.]|jgi:predicted PurR-regulated permease PerM